MLEQLFAYFTERSLGQLFRDALDVFIVYYMFYRALLVVRGTRAIQVGVGLGAVLLLYVLAQRLQLETVLNILGALISSMILIVVVVFQADIRRGLMRLGRGASLGGWKNAESQVIDDVVEAATTLARHRMGAIICFEKEANLDEFVENSHKGIKLDAQVSQELLLTLFVPESTNKLHDGAVIIRNLRIAKAGVFFPMNATKAMDSQFGSRHRAAMSITEETDAVLVIVSEERGTISFCFNGNIVSPISPSDLKSMLEAEVGPKKKARSGKAPPKAPQSVASGARPSTATKPPQSLPSPEPKRISSPPEPAEAEQRPSRPEERRLEEDTGPISRRAPAPASADRPSLVGDETPKPLRTRPIPRSPAEAEADPLDSRASGTPLAPTTSPIPLKKLTAEAGSPDSSPAPRITGTPLAPTTSPIPLRKSIPEVKDSSTKDRGSDA